MKKKKISDLSNQWLTGCVTRQIRPQKDIAVHDQVKYRLGESAFIFRTLDMGGPSGQQ